jgi:hypothetical protein
LVTIVLVYTVYKNNENNYYCFLFAFISLLYAYTFCVIVFLLIYIVMHKIFLCTTADFVISHSVVESTKLLLSLSFVLIAMLIAITAMASLIGIYM